MEHLTGPGHVFEQYRAESRLATRRSVWRTAAPGSGPRHAAAAAVGVDVRTVSVVLP